MTNNNNTEALTIENLCEKDKKRKMKFLGNKKGNNKFFDKIKINEEVKNDNNNFLNKSFTMFNITGKLYNYEIDKLKNNDYFILFYNYLFILLSTKKFFISLNFISKSL